MPSSISGIHFKDIDDYTQFRTSIRCRLKGLIGKGILKSVKAHEDKYKVSPPNNLLGQFKDYFEITPFKTGSVASWLRIKSYGLRGWFSYGLSNLEIIFKLQGVGNGIMNDELHWCWYYFGRIVSPVPADGLGHELVLERDAPRIKLAILQVIQIIFAAWKFKQALQQVSTKRLAIVPWYVTSTKYITIMAMLRRACRLYWYQSFIVQRLVGKGIESVCRLKKI